MKAKETMLREMMEARLLNSKETMLRKTKEARLNNTMETSSVRRWRRGS
jgi:hypothetical protein